MINVEDPRVVRLIMSVLGGLGVRNNADREDLSQEVLLRLWRNPTPRNEPAFICTVTRNVAYSAGRRPRLPQSLDCLLETGAALA